MRLSLPLKQVPEHDNVGPFGAFVGLSFEVDVGLEVGRDFTVGANVVFLEKNKA
jgi:hypothetical protein